MLGQFTRKEQMEQPPGSRNSRAGQIASAAIRSKMSLSKEFMMDTYLRKIRRDTRARYNQRDRKYLV
ncbi:hypothetical protein T265_04453 [Opisthorchis viverrini]|uniref:Uncharacterized protein n=1 Tax=Opisthorchis viverrini TaxID=6198 RepID=A0A074ZSG3_OPIVI|nr:hypothetical protein T265_04453 [Opisthorchis viverrini]KER28762.1 hypothetical protein T265_04453 [Opisthorchis viverrini]